MALLHQHGPVQVREHHPQVGVAKMDPDQRSCLGCQAKGHCPPTARARRLGAELDQHLGLDQVGHERRDGRGGQAGHPS
jgi:hypothetical protein